jgi:hypothetical protein
MRLNHRTAIVCSGMLWLVIGVMLLYKGMNLIMLAVQIPSSAILLPKIAPLTRGIEQAALILMCVGIFVGFMKAKFIFSKTVNRVVSRIVSFAEPVPISQIYTKGYIILILGMSALGMSLKFFHLPHDVLGLLDVVIGSALTQGAMLYFRAAAALSKKAA